MRTLPHRQLLEATEQILGRSVSIAGLGHYLGDAVFLAGHLADANDPAEPCISVALELLEEIYAVALDRQWSELPSEEAAMAGAAVEEIARALGDVKDDGEQS
jgi:AAA+ superfamily predicted ATPase